MVTTVRINGINYSVRLPAETVASFARNTKDGVWISFVLKRRGESVDAAMQKANRISAGAPVSEITNVAAPLNLLQFGVDAESEDVLRVFFRHDQVPDEPATVELADSDVLTAMTSASPEDSELSALLKANALKSESLGAGQRNLPSGETSTDLTTLKGE